MLSHETNLHLARKSSRRIHDTVWVLPIIICIWSASRAWKRTCHRLRMGQGLINVIGRRGAENVHLRAWIIHRLHWTLWKWKSDNLPHYRQFSRSLTVHGPNFSTIRDNAKSVGAMSTMHSGKHFLKNFLVSKNFLETWGSLLYPFSLNPSPHDSFFFRTHQTAVFIRSRCWLPEKGVYSSPWR